MSEIVMGKDKKVGDSIFITEIDEGISVVGKPDVARNPMTGKLEKILTVVTVDRKTRCPKCKEENEPGIEGIEITVTETGLCIYPCKRCNQFVWFKMKNK